MGGRAGGRAHKWTGAPGGHADKQASGRGWARWADERTGADNGQMSGRADGAAEGRTGWRIGELADGRTTDFRR